MDILNNRLIKTELVEWKKLVPFQPDNLKKTEPHKLQKLANSLCQNGFSMNFYVWEKEGQILIIDGHSRHEVLQLLETGAIYPKNPDGKEYAVTIPEKLPCSFLHLKNKTEAKKAVLIYNSKYKNIDSDILAEWVSDLNLDELKSQIEIPELNFKVDGEKDIFNDVNEKYNDDIMIYNPDVKLDKEIGDYDIPKLMREKIYQFDSRTISTHISDNAMKTDLYLWIIGSSKIPKDLSNTVVGFYTDDYRFEKMYTDPGNYVKELLNLNVLACCMPNFSMYIQWARAVRIYNLYRSFWVGRYFQECGINIIPDLQLNKEDYEIIKSIYPKEIPSVSIQFHTSKKDKEFIKTKIELLKDICLSVKPESILVYTDNAFLKEINCLDSINSRVIPILSYMETKRFQGVI
jgi:hypothetical protein